MSAAAIQTEETLIIETPERVPLHFALASIGNRFLACAFDHALQTVAFLVLYFVFDALVSSLNVGGMAGASRWAVALLIIFAFLIWSSYFIIFEWRMNGQTPGKRWLKLRVIREDGRPITFWEASVRNLLRLFDIMPLPFYSIGLISLFISTRGQRVGDLVAGTVVVRERETEAPTFNQVFDSPVSDVALRRACKPVRFTADIGPVTEPEIEVVETFLRRRYDLPDHARMWMAWRVATPLLYKLRPGYDLATFTYEGFLEELLHRYHERHRFKK
ncbi:MAG TPA: RDD family protein [Pyrinomonadaceae bacterium]|nr:RDD family protein [Pyrinomonadaceae bacterium]